MYLVETGLGEPFRPRRRSSVQQPPRVPANPPQAGWVAKDGHRRFCVEPSGRTVGCDLHLKVRFRRSFDEFLRAVEEAYGRWMAKPTAQRVMKTLRDPLKKMHQDMLYSKILDHDPIVLVAGLYYKRSNGAWLVDGSSLRQYGRVIDL